jgi:hypothetical protein
MMVGRGRSAPRLYYLFNLEGRIRACQLLRRINPTVTPLENDPQWPPLGGGGQRGRDGQTKRLGSLQVDDQFNFRGL